MEYVKAIGFREDTDATGSQQWNMIGEDNLEISDGRLKFGDICIPYEAISDAVLNENTKDGTYKTLYVDTGLEKFMFNLNLNRDYILELPFAVVNTEGGPLEIKGSPLLKFLIASLALSLILVLIGIYAQ